MMKFRKRTKQKESGGQSFFGERSIEHLRIKLLREEIYTKRLHESLRRIAERKYRFLSPRKRVIMKAVKEYYGKKHKSYLLSD